MRICHIADVHYRSLSRHDEYREVFNFLAESCVENKVDHIVVCGDIFHTKTTGISPEYIYEITWWMKRLSSVATLHLTLGNHDGNLANLNRQDSITPIYEALKNDSSLKNKIFLYKDSGVYQLDDRHNLCVYSLFDKQGWNKVSPQIGKYNIAVYHGPVNNAVSETGWKMTSDVTVQKFEDYDIALLGDIHKLQYLGHKNINGKKVPWIAYPGTPVQQGYAEELEHGYLLWDISDSGHDVSFIKLPNVKPYITINWNDNISSSDVPPLSRVRVKHDRPLTQLEINTLQVKLRELGVTETTYTLNKIELPKQIIKSSAGEVKNFHNSDVLVDLLKDNGKSYTFTEEEWSEISKLVESYIKITSSKEDVIRNVKWSLKELKFDNLFGYCEGNVINFEKLNGIVGIFGQNRIGKSSIIGSLAYCLFNSSDRGSLKNLDMINVRKPHAYARVVLDIDGCDHVIERQTVKNQTSRGTNAITSVNLFKLEGDDARDLNGEQRSDTDKLIRGMIGTSEDFMLTTLSAQGDIDRFIKEGSSYRKKVLNRFLDIDFFDELHDVVKHEVSSLKTELKTLQSLKLPEEKEIDRDISVLTEQISLLEVERDENVSTQSSLKAKFDGMSLDTKSISSRKEKERLLENCNESIKKIDLEIEEINNKILETTISVDSLSSELGQLDIATAKSTLLELNQLRENKLSFSHTLEKSKTELDRKNRSIKVLSEVPCGDSFPDCKFIKDAYRDKKLIDKSIEDVANYAAQLQRVTERILALEKLGIDSIIKKEVSIRDSLSKLDLQLHKLNSVLESRLDKKSGLILVKSNLEIEISELPTTSAEVESKIIEIATQIRDLKDRCAKINSLLSEKFSQRGSLLEQKRRSAEVKEKLDEKLQHLKIREFIATSFSKKGLPTKILSEQLPLINQQVSQVLAGIVDFNIELECTDATSLEVYINYGDSRRAIELCSGMEKMISSLAIRAALTTVSVIPRSDILIIDEGFGSLDDAGVDSCKKLLVSLKDFFKSILIISHVPSIKDVADTVLEIQRIEKDSRINYA